MASIYEVTAPRPLPEPRTVEAALLAAVRMRCGSPAPEDLHQAWQAIRAASRTCAMGSSAGSCLRDAAATEARGLHTSALLWTAKALGYLGGYDWITVERDASALAAAGVQSRQTECD